MRISVGLPLYDGKTTYQQMGCLLTEILIADKAGHTLNVRVLPACTNLAMGRNQLVKEFMESEDDRLVFLDADVTFEPGSLVKLAQLPEDFVGGIYRYKKEKEDYPLSFLDKPELWANEHGLLEVRMVPTGFLALSRNVFERFSAAHPGREYDNYGDKTYCYFQIPYFDGSLFTEDAYFCKEWREMGGQIFMDPELTLSHWQGNIEFKGHIGNWLKRNAGIPITEKGESRVPLLEIPS